ncbi:hypothetical protein OAZ27_06155 [Bacteroidia bacterium]|nr:hypothetical protein [Bacteroidia bacterium]
MDRHINTISFLPSWWNMDLYTKGRSVKSKINSKKVKLSAEESAVFDFICGFDLAFKTYPKSKNAYYVKLLNEATTWLKEKNPQGYSSLFEH